MRVSVTGVYGRDHATGSDYWAEDVPRLTEEDTMTIRHHNPVRLDDPMSMLTGCHLQDLELEADRMQLAWQACGARPRSRAPIQALLKWLSILTRWRPPGTPSSTPGTLDATATPRP